MLDLRDLLTKAGLDPDAVMVMRHRPTSPDLRRALLWLAADRPDVYNAYQRIHGPRVEGALSRATHLVSCIGTEPGKALFVGVYAVAGWNEVSVEEWRLLPASRELLELGDRGPEADRDLRHFDLRITEDLRGLKGRLLLSWPGLERSWWRWAARNQFAVEAIHRDCELTQEIPPWTKIVLRWAELKVLPKSWKSVLAQWRGVYLILDRESGKGYIGSAYGADNILARWEAYAATGHGGNVELKGRNPANFQFSILERVSPDLTADEVIGVEASWKDRLGTREVGLNRN